MPRRIHAVLAAGVLVSAGCGIQSNSAAPADPWQSAGSGWVSLAPPPFARWSAVSVWTGRKLFFWGGDTNYDATHHADGALYDPAGDRWQRVASGPLDGRSGAGAVWTGKEVFVWGGRGNRGDLNDGALFEPRSGTWRMLPPAPLSARTPVSAVWTGSEVIVWGDMSRARRAAQREGAAYDPNADAWRKLAAAPVGLNLAEAVWTGEELVVFGALLDGRNFSATGHAQGIAYDPETDSWRVIRDYPLSPQASSVTWTGKEILAWDYELAAGAYDPARDSWRRIGRLPLRFSECYPESARLRETVLAWSCGEGASFDIATSKWQVLPVAPGEVHGRPVSTGSVALFVADRLWAYRS